MAPPLLVGLVLAFISLAQVQLATFAQYYECHQPYDIVFVIDGSGSIQFKNTPGVDNWVIVKQFAADMVMSFTVGPQYTQFGAVLFSDTAQSQFYLNTHSSRGSVQSAIGGIPYPGAGTNTSGGLYIMRTDQFVFFRGDRPGIQNIAIVITDGESTIDREKTQSEAQLAKDNGVKIYTIGVTYDVNEDEIRRISSAPQTRDTSYFLVASFTDLLSIVNVIVNQICFGTPSPTPAPRPPTTFGPSMSTLFFAAV